MRSMYGEVAIIIFVIGLLSACGTQATATPASSPTEAVLPATQAPTDPPLSTDTAAPTDSLPATEPAAAAQGATVSFANDVLPIIESRYINCHGGDRVEKGLNLKTYTDVMAGSENGPVVTAGNADGSKLVELIVNQKMPKRGPKLTPPQVQLITEWVNQGALNN